MKKILIPIFSILLLATSCNEDEFLTKVNPNTITQDTFWKTPTDFDKALTTVYGALQFAAISGGSRLQNEEVMTDLAGTDSWYPGFTFRVLTFNDASQYVNDKWNQLYIGVFRANQVIEKINANPIEGFIGNEKEQVEAQARALRAFFYFDLVNAYGNVVMHKEVPKNKEDFKKPLQDRKTIIEQIVIPDLEFALNNLPDNWGGNDLGRTTKGMAMALLGKVYLFDKNWPKAAEMFRGVINSGLYTLVPDPMDNFTDQNEFNKESIFEVVYSGKFGPGIPAPAIDDTPFSNGAESSDFAAVLAPLPKGGFNTLVPSYYLHELMANDEVDSDNPINKGRVESARMYGSIFPRRSTSEYYQLENTQSVFFNPFISAFIKKYTNWYQFKNEDAINNKTGINFRHIRLADVYLMYAEAILNANGNAAIQEAQGYIDQVRRRAGVKTLATLLQENNNKMPQMHISKQVVGVTPLVNLTAENLLTHIRLVERPLELCFEGHRWNDLKRWGITKSVYDAMKADEDWRIANAAKFTADFAPLYINGGSIRPDFKIASQTYSSERHDFFPIPSNEVQANENL